MPLTKAQAASLITQGRLRVAAARERLMAQLAALDRIGAAYDNWESKNNARAEGDR